MSWTVNVSPVATGDRHECKAELGRMARGDGICGHPAIYTLTAGQLVTHCCGQHLRQELDLVGSMAARFGAAS